MNTPAKPEASQVSLPYLTQDVELADIYSSWRRPNDLWWNTQGEMGHTGKLAGNLGPPDGTYLSTEELVMQRA